MTLSVSARLVEAVRLRVGECDYPPQAAALAAEPMARKHVLSMSKGPRRAAWNGSASPSDRAFIAEECEAARDLFETGQVRPSAQARAKAEAFFREVVRG